MQEQHRIRPIVRIKTNKGQEIIYDSDKLWIVTERKSAIQEIGQALKPLFKMINSDCQIITLPNFEATKKRFIGQSVDSEQLKNIEQTPWRKFFRKNKDNERLLQQLKEIIFFRFLVGFAINPTAIEVLQFGEQIVLHSAHEGRLDRRIRSSKREPGLKTSIKDEYQYEADNWEVYGQLKPSIFEDSDADDEDSNDYQVNAAFFVSIDAEAEIRRITGSLSRMDFEKWLNKVGQVIFSIDGTRYMYLVAEMREKVTNLVQFEEWKKSSRVESDEATDKEKARESHSGRPKAVIPVTPKSTARPSEWRTLEEYPQLEISATGKIRSKSEQKIMKIRVYDDYPFVLLNRTTKVRADKLVYKAFSKYSGEFRDLRITTLDEDPGNIAFANLVKSRSNRSQIHKPRAVLRIHDRTGEETTYSSMNKAAKANTESKTAKINRLCKSGNMHKGYQFQFVDDT